MRLLHALSFDVEEHFQVANFARVVQRADWDGHASRVEANVERILVILDRARTGATFFVLGWVAERHPALLRRIAAAGHEIASHGYDHRFVHDLGESGFRDDVRRTKGILETAIGQPVLGFRASTFTITRRTPWALAVLAEEGHRYDASIFPVRHPSYGIPDAPRNVRVERLVGGRSIVEFPPLTIRALGRNWPAGGGGYFRLLPLRVTAWAFDRAEREGLPGSLYLHPWEFDPEQPRIDAGWLSGFRHRVNLARTAPRLERLLSHFRFGTMRSAIEAALGPAALGPAALGPAALEGS
jgi:polysaccharide deacetylase family protein (PEP-CTERM system associated)